MMGNSSSPGTLPSVLSLGLVAWSSWPQLDPLQAHQSDAPAPPPSGEISAKPDIEFVEPMSRRRLGNFARIALHTANRAAGPSNPDFTIFASRHGELARNVRILHDLADKQMPSPASFSLSVHNATAAVLSIARRDTAPSTAIAAGDETLLWALLEAKLRLDAKPDATVLITYVDEPVPTEYSRYVEHQAPAHALSLLVTQGTDLRLAFVTRSGSTASDHPLSLCLLKYLSGKAFEWTGARFTVSGALDA